MKKQLFLTQNEKVQARYENIRAQLARKWKLMDFKDPNYTPVLLCENCHRLTAHKQVDDQKWRLTWSTGLKPNDTLAFRETYVCLICETERPWGASGEIEDTPKDCNHPARNLDISKAVLF